MTPREDKLVLLTLGSDPEVPIYNSIEEKYVFAGTYLEGTKHEPFIFTDEGHTIQTDCTMAEFTFPPCTTAEQMWNHIQRGLNYINSKLPEGTEYDLVASALYDDKELSDPQAKEAGCSPDWNAWKCEVNESPQLKSNMRSAGAHIHFGFERESGEPISMMDQMQVIRHCDLFYGLPSIIIDNSMESKRRKQLYGKAGAFRPCSYGVEYRSLGNFWLTNRQYIDWIFDTSKLIFKLINSGNILDDEKDNLIAQAMDNNDEKLAKQIMSSYNVKLPQIWEKAVPRTVVAV